MANRRIRSKQIKAHQRNTKTLEGYEKFLLKQKMKWEGVLQKAGKSYEQEREARNNIYHYHRAHENLRKFYFDI